MTGWCIKTKSVFKGKRVYLVLKPAERLVGGLFGVFLRNGKSCLASIFISGLLGS